MNNLIVDVSVGIAKKTYEIENLLQKYNFCVLRGAVNQDSIIEGIKKFLGPKNHKKATEG